ncbi:asparagine synthase-related protein [Sphaerisporangium flaviroseum]
MNLVPTNLDSSKLPGITRGTPGFVAVGHKDGRLCGPMPGMRLPGDLVWPGAESVRAYGPWQKSEIITAVCGPSRLLVLGHCLLPEAQVRQEFSVVAERGEFDRLTDWPGAYLCLVAQPDRVLLYTDLAGQFTAHFSICDGQFVMATHSRVVAALHGRAPDSLATAARIAFADTLRLHLGRSPYTGVYPVEGATMLEVTRDGVRTRRYHDRLPRHGVTFTEAADSLRRSLVDAIERRGPRGPITTDLSGGVDSAAIACLTAHLLGGPIRAVNYHNRAAPTADLAEAVRAADLDDALKLSVVHGGKETLPYRGLFDADMFVPGEPTSCALAYRRARLRVQWAAAQSSGVHLTGEGGDALLWAGRSRLVDLARQGAVLRTVRDGTALARVRHVSPAATLAKVAFQACTSERMALRRLARRLRHPDTRHSRLTPAQEVVCWLTADMREALAAAAEDPAILQALPRGITPGTQAVLTELRSAAEAQRYLRELGARDGVAVHAPFLDNSVVDACLSLPVTQRTHHRLFKPLLAAALHGLVPTEITGRATKGNHQTEEYRGARQARSDIMALLDDSVLAKLGVIDSGAVRTTLSKLFTGVAVPMGPLNRLLASEIWMRLDTAS